MALGSVSLKKSIDGVETKLVIWCSLAIVLFRGRKMRAALEMRSRCSRLLRGKPFKKGFSRELRIRCMMRKGSKIEA